MLASHPIQAQGRFSAPFSRTMPHGESPPCGSFEDPTSPSGDPPRESIEVRTLLAWALGRPADAWPP